MITLETKQRILAAMVADRENYPSDAKHAASLGISTAVYSAVKGGATEKVLSEPAWIGIARRLGVSLRKEMEWKPANTPTYQYITSQLTMCQESGISAVMCDIPNIGKTYSARLYVRGHKNAVYVDCSQVKTKRRLIKHIAREFGVSATGKYQEMYDDLVFYLRSIEQPLVILDEAGDLQYEAFLELKALWNATERMCAWYMMGADGLQEKINRSISCKKVGYAEMFSRYGEKFSKVTPDDGKEREKFLLSQASMVAAANAPKGTDIKSIVRQSAGGLRRIYTEIEKLSRI
jgi:hypothetical protein